MTQKQKEWASQHDWFIRAGVDGVYVIDTETSKICEFTDFMKLKIWAGY